MALFLVVAGLTGSILPFEQDLTFLSRPGLAYLHPPHRGASPLDGVAIAHAVERQTGGVVGYIPLDIAADHVARMFVAARPGQPPLPFDVAWANPYTGAVKLTYRWGGLHDGPENIVPFLFSVHYGLVAGPWGRLTFGIIALIWTLDCFVGFYLTLPRIRTASSLSSVRPLPWLRRWSAAWKIRRHARGHRLNFDLHRAAGLWLWPLLLAFAWSSVGLLLPQVEQPVMRAFGAHADYTPSPAPAAVVSPPMEPKAAMTRGEAELARLGLSDGFRMLWPEGLSYDPNTASYRLDALTTLDAGSRTGATSVWIDARTGAIRHWSRPFGDTPADAARRLFQELHFADLLGLPYRIFVSIIGLLVASLSVTGVLVWVKKRTARAASSSRTLRNCAERAVNMEAPASTAWQGHRSASSRANLRAGQ